MRKCSFCKERIGKDENYYFVVLKGKVEDFEYTKISISVPQYYHEKCFEVMEKMGK